MMQDRQQNRQNQVFHGTRADMWRRLRPLVIVVVSAAIAVGLMVGAVQFVLRQYIAPPDIHDATPIIVTIPTNSSASQIARILYEAGDSENSGLISNTAVFKIYVDFVGKANKLQAGTYTLSRNMSVSQIVDEICHGNPPRATVRFTIPEGSTIEDIATILEGKGLLEDRQAFLDLCKTGEAFQDTYEFIRNIPHEHLDEREYALEGYLFPDTYDVFEDAALETIINKMLLRFFEIFDEAHIEQSQEMEMTVDQVMALASLIEREARDAEDFARVSAVFHNRLKRDQRLESCASLNYVLKTKKYTFTEEERNTQSHYNTYLNVGLPLGPICNPGQQAIEAALNPNQKFIDEGYLYFCNANPEETNTLVFAKNYKDHVKNIEKYSKYW